ncbi:MAG: ZIP family metal transporter [Candidatus Marinimicrobia bacterium]|nr:ZIP family metal transporter [Candidatus Neomarinimicrobiota bacterium]
MDIFFLKLFSLLIIFTVGLFAGIAPTRRSLSQQGERKLIWGNAFAGGVFLGAGLLHMLPDAVENFNTFAGDIDFPFPALICGIGFLFVLLLEKVNSGGHHHAEAETEKRSVYPFLLLFVLSIHSIIAGTSLGLEVTLVSATAIFIAIIAHKGAAAFALGVSLKKGGISKEKHIVTICFFAAMTPLGVLLGTIFSKILSSNTNVVFEAVFDSLAAGTFLYIAIVDIIGEVFQRSSDRWIKLLLIIGGFALMAMIAIWA